MVNRSLSNLLDSGVIKVKKKKSRRRTTRKKRLSKPILVEKLDNIKVDEIAVLGKTPDGIPIETKLEIKVKKTPIIKVKKGGRRKSSRRTRRKSRKVSLTVNDKKENSKNLNNLINHVKRKSPEDMIEGLKNKGIYVSGNNPRLLKDIYLYSLNDNIRIIKE